MFLYVSIVDIAFSMAACRSAREADPAPATHGRPVDGGDDGLRQAFELGDEVTGRQAHLGAPNGITRVAEVGSPAEVALSGARHDHDADAVVGPDLVNGVDRL